ncbi:acyltransferase [Sphingomonas sp. LB-2]|uniref:acyltransferase family protein n=1 Tax=Sphingomonas caeni TaxID=2984949 RepID=UPI00222E8B30|nr:acyltransferase [Sphingomonas caeni]MCW3848443.1 acyltransferase [Sphingomonas caeni]
MGAGAARERFLALDGLRGVAALAVLLFHLQGTMRIGWAFAHGYLAVDFFFMLSGFVIAHAYEARLRAPGGLGPFLRDRVIRLHPLLVLSLIPPGAMLLASMIAGEPPYAHPLLTLAVAFLPFPAFWIAPPYKFPLNSASWSLFWELVVNLAFALAAPRLNNRLLGAIVAAAVAGAVGVSLCNHGLLDPGPTAGFRAFAGFAIGVGLLRVHRLDRFRADRLGLIAAPLLLLSLAAVPISPRVATLYDPLIVFGLFPLILLASARREARFPGLCAWLGGLSYPVYVLQAPVLKLIHRPLAAAIPYPLASGLVQCAIVVAVSLIAWRLYDEPVRRALRRRFASGRAPDKRDRPAA